MQVRCSYEKTSAFTEVLSCHFVAYSAFPYIAEAFASPSIPREYRMVCHNNVTKIFKFYRKDEKNRSFRRFLINTLSR